MIQIDMSMPTNCLDCPACNEYLICAIPINGRKWRAKDVREFDRGRPEWCPMEEQEDLGTELTNAMELIHKKNERIKKLEEQIETLTRWRMNAGAFD